MAKITDEFYAILKATKRFGTPVNGQRPVQEFAVTKIRRGQPYTDKGEIAVRLRVTLDSTVFDELIPTVDIEIGEKDLFVNTKVEILPVAPEADES